MKSQTLRLCLIAALSCATTAALAENPFAGTWTVDYSKSHVTGQTLSFTSEAGGKVRVTEANNTYTFKPDGTDTKNSAGETVQWKQMDSNTWKEFTKAGSMVVTDTWVLGSDGKTLQDTATGTRPDGKQMNDSVSYTRIAPGKGFFGKWKSTKVDNSTPQTAQIEANGDNGIIWHIPEIKASVTLTFDGKEVTPTGPTVPAGLTLSATKMGPRSFELTDKINGKLLFKGRYTVSADGKTMTEVGSAPGAAPTKVVFQKS
ncbi:MAG TPA: hypothetical protein VFW25_07145 [Silvibacterium sp.]|nr:hypothetical protein [Silvibacterium sp.]